MFKLNVTDARRAAEKTGGAADLKLRWSLSGSLGRLAAVAGLAAALAAPTCTFAAAAAASQDDAETQDAASSPYATTVAAADCPLFGTVADDAVAVTVNGEELPVATLTAYIAAVRDRVGSQTDAAWEAYLADQGYTVEGYWDALIEHYGREMVLTQRAAELGIEVGTDEVDARIQEIKEALGVADEDSAFLWDAYLELYGFTEDTLRANQAYYLQRDKLYEAEVARPEVTDELVQRYADAYASQYGLEPDDDGAVDLAAADADLLAQIQADAAELAWDWACSTYVDGLWAAADVQVLVDHQYDVEGQSHGAA